MTESDIQNSIIRRLREHGFIVIRLNSGMAKNNVRLAPPGTPDLLAVGFNGRVMWIEVKREGGKLRDTQIEMHNDLTERGHLVVVARSADDVPVTYLLGVDQGL